MSSALPFLVSHLPKMITDLRPDEVVSRLRAEIDRFRNAAPSPERAAAVTVFRIKTSLWGDRFRDGVSVRLIGCPEDKLVIGRPNVLVVASVAPQPRLAVDHSEVEACREVIIISKPRGSDGERSRWGAASAQHTVWG